MRISNFALILILLLVSCDGKNGQKILLQSIIFQGDEETTRIIRYVEDADGNRLVEMTKGKNVLLKFKKGDNVMGLLMLEGAKVSSQLQDSKEQSLTKSGTANNILTPGNNWHPGSGSINVEATDPNQSTLSKKNDMVQINENLSIKLFEKLDSFVESGGTDFLEAISKLN